MYDQTRQDQLRKLWNLWHKHRDRAIHQFCKATGIAIETVCSEPWMYRWDGLELPSFPLVLSEMTCGAKTRKGTPCKRKDLYSSGRCKFHGGMSTGPRTEEGKRRCAENGKRATQRKLEAAKEVTS